MRFLYTAMDMHGKECRGTVDALTEQEAANKIKANNLFPTSIAEYSGKQIKITKKGDSKIAKNAIPFAFGLIVGIIIGILIMVIY